jgi:hypothetical protein
VLDPAAVDLAELCGALDDRSDENAWYVHAVDGRVRLSTTGVREGEDVDDPLWRPVPRAGSAPGYRDMADFVAGVHRGRAADLLDRAIAGRGAFRRFRETLQEFPDLRDRWFRFRDARARRRALQWLVDEGLADPDAAARVAARYPDPADDGGDLAAAVAAELRALLGPRLRRVLADAGEDVLALVVVLEDPVEPWRELPGLDALLWRHTERSGTAVTALPVGEADLAAPASPLLARAAAAARVVA